MHQPGPSRGLAAALLALACAGCAASGEPATMPAPTPARAAPGPLLLGDPTVRVLADRTMGAGWRSFGPSQVLAPVGTRRMLGPDVGAPRVFPLNPDPSTTPSEATER